jgi:hypothetical protein
VGHVYFGLKLFIDTVSTVECLQNLPYRDSPYTLYY